MERSSLVNDFSFKLIYLFCRPLPCSREDVTVALDSEGFGPNERRETGHVFSSYALQRFLQCHTLSHVVRAHQVQMDGFQVRNVFEKVHFFYWNIFRFVITPNF